MSDDLASNLIGTVTGYLLFLLVSQFHPATGKEAGGTVEKAAKVRAAWTPLLAAGTAFVMGFFS